MFFCANTCAVNLQPKGSNLLLFREDPCSEGRQTNFDKLVSHVSVSIPLIYANWWNYLHICKLHIKLHISILNTVLDLILYTMCKEQSSNQFKGNNLIIIVYTFSVLKMFISFWSATVYWPSWLLSMVSEVGEYDSFTWVPRLHRNHPR